MITDATGYTRIVLKLIEYTGGIAQTDAALLASHLEQFRKKLSAQLGEELK